MKKITGIAKKVVCLTTAAIMITGLAACGSTSTAPAAETKAAETKAEAAADTQATADTQAAAAYSGESYEIVVNLTQSSEAAHTKMIKEQLEKITEASNGGLTFTVYDSGTLAKIPDTYEAVTTGLCDITFMPSNIGQDTLPLNGRLVILPMMGYTSETQAFEIYNTICEEYPEINQECEAQGLVKLGAWFNGPVNLYMSKDASIAGADDLKGMKIGNSDANVTAMIGSAGATGVFVSSADAYTSLDNGVVDGIMQHALFFRVTGCTDIVKTVVEFSDTGLQRGTSMLMMNKSKFDSLPAELQQILVDGFKEITAMAQDIEANDLATYKQALVDAGANYITLSEDQYATVLEQAATIQTTTISELEGQNISAQAIFDRIQELIAQ